MNMAILDQLCEIADNFYNRGYAYGATGNVSVRIGDSVWITPTGKPLKGLIQAQLACTGLGGRVVNDNQPSKEIDFHLAVYRHREDALAVVHLHSIYSLSLSCLENLEMENPHPPITPYYVMRVAPLAVLPYFRPGSPDLAEAVGGSATSHNCMLLRNHGLITLGRSLAEAADRAEELEAAAQLFFILRGQDVRGLTMSEVAELRRVFGQMK